MFFIKNQYTTASSR